MFNIFWTEGILLGILLVGIQWYWNYRSFVSEKEREARQMKTENKFEDIKKHIDDHFERFEDLLDKKVDFLESEIVALDKEDNNPLKAWDQAP